VRHSNWEAVIQAAMGPATSYLASLPNSPVYRPTDPGEIRALLAGPFPEDGADPEQVVAALARDLEPCLSAHASGSDGRCEVKTPGQSECREVFPVRKTGVNQTHNPLDAGSSPAGPTIVMWRDIEIPWPSGLGDSFWCGGWGQG